ncbi:hypothetical protein V500_02553 [Pseudogymnoascus sp. VKM F-4518 (FW-2643)]|nr:hypothetical protein V500_02553 [Pseudogymnoascus sp. VKM F-4518 (FW-2643)]
MHIQPQSEENATSRAPWQKRDRRIPAVVRMILVHLSMLTGVKLANFVVVPKAFLGNTPTTPPNRLGVAPDPIPSKSLPREEPTYASAARTAATPSTNSSKASKAPPKTRDPKR